jgi:hypothetical protein
VVSPPSFSRNVWCRHLVSVESVSPPRFIRNVWCRDLVSVESVVSPPRFIRNVWCRHLVSVESVSPPSFSTIKYRYNHHYNQRHNGPAKLYWCKTKLSQFYPFSFSQRTLTISTLFFLELIFKSFKQLFFERGSIKLRTHFLFLHPSNMFHDLSLLDLTAVIATNDVSGMSIFVPC